MAGLVAGALAGALPGALLSGAAGAAGLHCAGSEAAGTKPVGAPRRLAGLGLAVASPLAWAQLQRAATVGRRVAPRGGSVVARRDPHGAKRRNAPRRLAPLRPGRVALGRCFARCPGGAPLPRAKRRRVSAPRTCVEAAAAGTRRRTARNECSVSNLPSDPSFTQSRYLSVRREMHSKQRVSVLMDLTVLFSSSDPIKMCYSWSCGAVC